MQQPLKSYENIDKGLFCIISLLKGPWLPLSPILSPYLPPWLSQQMAEQLMTLAYENGINLFDTAEVYAAGKWVYPVPQISRQ